MTGIKRVLFIGALAALVSTGVATDASAGWWWHGCGYGCSTGYYGAYYPTYDSSYVSGYAGCCSSSYACYYPTCYDSCCGGAWYSGSRCGVRSHLLGSHRYYWSGSTCCYGGCAGYGYVGWSSSPTCCGGDGGVIVSGGTVTMPAPTPAMPTPATPTPPPSPPTPTTPGGGAAPGGTAPALPPPPAGGYSPPTTFLTPTPAESGLLTVYVPAEAKVTVNGYETKSTGTKRQYVSYGLQAGQSYKYEIKAEIVRDGQIVDETKTVVMVAGSRNTAQFAFAVEPTESLAANR